MYYEYYNNIVRNVFVFLINSETILTKFYKHNIDSNIILYIDNNSLYLVS